MTYDGLFKMCEMFSELTMESQEAVRPGDSEVELNAMVESDLTEAKQFLEAVKKEFSTDEVDSRIDDIAHAIAEVDVEGTEESAAEEE